METTMHASGTLAKSASYDHRSRRLRIELESGVEVRIPVAMVQGLADAHVAAIRMVRVEGGGYGLYWPTLDLDLSVAGLLAGRFGSRAWMTARCRKGGEATSPATRRASRENG